MLPSLLCACSLFKYIICSICISLTLIHHNSNGNIVYNLYFLLFVACDHLKVYGWRPLSFPFNHESTKISVYVIISCLDRCILQSFCTFLLQFVVILHLLWSLCVFMVIYIYFSLFLDFFGSYSSLSGIYNRAQKPLSVRALRASQVGSVNVGPYEKSPMVWMRTTSKCSLATRGRHSR